MYHSPFVRLPNSVLRKLADLGEPGYQYVKRASDPQEALLRAPAGTVAPSSFYVSPKAVFAALKRFPPFQIYCRNIKSIGKIDLERRQLECEIEHLAIENGELLTGFMQTAWSIFENGGQVPLGKPGLEGWGETGQSLVACRFRPTPGRGTGHGRATELSFFLVVKKLKILCVERKNHGGYLKNKITNRIKTAGPPKLTVT